MKQAATPMVAQMGLLGTCDQIESTLDNETDEETYRPSSSAQAALIRDTYEKAGLNPASIDDRPQ